MLLSPKLYSELTTAQVLVMEYVDGYSVSDTHTLEQEGYDLVEIGEKLADNYVRQIMQDGFFHADPHPEILGFAVEKLSGLIWE